MPKKKAPPVNGSHPIDPIEEPSLDRLPEQEFVPEPVVEEAVETTQQPTRGVPYAPVPMSFRISQSQGAETTLVSLLIQTAEGDKVFFLDSDTGKQLGEALTKMSEASANGVVYSD